MAFKKRVKSCMELINNRFYFSYIFPRGLRFFHNSEGSCGKVHEGSQAVGDCTRKKMFIYFSSILEINLTSRVFDSFIFHKCAKAILVNIQLGSCFK